MSPPMYPARAAAAGPEEAPLSLAQAEAVAAVLRDLFAKHPIPPDNGSPYSAMGNMQQRGARDYVMQRLHDPEPPYPSMITGMNMGVPLQELEAVMAMLT